MPKPLTPIELFIKTWEESSSVKEVSQKLNISEKEVNNYVFRLRRKGCQLKKFKERVSVGDVNELNKMLKLTQDKEIVTAEKFVKAWISSETIHEVCIKLKMKRADATNRAWKLRKKGVRLPKFGTACPPTNVKALNELIDKMQL